MEGQRLHGIYTCVEDGSGERLYLHEPHVFNPGGECYWDATPPTSKEYASDNAYAAIRDCMAKRAGQAAYVLAGAASIAISRNHTDRRFFRDAIRAHTEDSLNPISTKVQVFEEHVGDRAIGGLGGNLLRRIANARGNQGRGR
jgi:hypothetical protein